MVWNAESALREAGMRVTRQRIAVLSALRDRPHATADTLTAATREALGSISVQAVYDVLAACAENGLVRRIQPAGSPARFETRTADNHHHLVCEVCGRVDDVDCVSGSAPCLSPHDAHGYDIAAAEVVFWGTCAQCGSAETAPAGRPSTKE
jgi:Fur family ferric uptake transcriptional regulator